MQHINYNHLYYFWIIAKEGGITPACKKLSLTQPTLSAQLKQFELAMGKPLFERKKRKLILNDAGKTLFDYADAMFKKSRDMLDVLKGSPMTDLVTLRVGALATLPKKNLHNYLKIPISSSHANVHLADGSFADLLAKLANRELDMVLATRPAPATMGRLASFLLERVPLVFVATPDFKNLKRKFPFSMEGANLFLPTAEPEIKKQLDLFFTQHNVKPRIKGEIQDTELLRVIAVSGQGIAAVVRTAVSDLIKSKELYIIGDNADIWQDFYLITAEKKEQNPLIQMILKSHGEGG
ncbi:MAG: LysR family transcriptional regulator [Deltaproteobacteria bacterium]|nr:LysR family transcriptional regulator [Deltaproteobacteria bacterium]